MAQTLPRYPVLDFSGGVRRDKSAFELDKNELLDAQNVHITDRGRVESRRGSQQLGDTTSGTIENSFFFVRAVAGTLPTTQFLTNTRDGSTILRRLIRTRLSAAVATSDTTISAVSLTGFANSGTVEIDGDLISYTGISGNDLTGVTGITFAHEADVGMNQWATVTQSGAAMDGERGISYAVINNILIMGGGGLNKMKQYDGTTVTDISGAPGIFLLTNYREKIYGAGSNSSGATNSSPRRIAFSARGDGTTWSSSDFFDVNDQEGAFITALRVYADRLGIFKTSSIFTYDEIELKQRVVGVGSYNQKVVQEINGLVYTFCPAGIFETNLFTARQIGEPVLEFWKNFVPKMDNNLHTVTNTFAWVEGDSYFLLLKEITTDTFSGTVVLEYNTKTRTWATHTGGYTNFEHVNNFAQFSWGDTRVYRNEGLFAGASGGQAWRLLENRYRGLESFGDKAGADIFVDLRSNTGNPISALVETGLYDFGQPNLWKTINGLRVYSERGQWTVEYRVENEKGVGPYQRLGTVTARNQVLPFPKGMAGTRVGLRVSSVNTANTSILNGFVFEDIELTERHG